MKVVRCLIIGLLWFIIYAISVGALIYELFGLTPFGVLFTYSAEQGVVLYNPFIDWVKLYRAFMFDQWTIDNLYDFSLLCCFLLFFPVWFWGWYRLCRVKWGALLFKPFKKAVQNTGKIKLMPRKKGLERPRALASTGWMPSTGTSVASASDSESMAPPEEERSFVPQQPQTKETSVQWINYLKETAGRYGFEVFEHVALENYVVPIVLATDTKALLFNFFDEPGSEWVVEGKPFEEGTTPKWYSAEDQIVSPFYQLCEAAHTLKEKEPTSVICPVLLVVGGVLLNPDALNEVASEENGAVLTDAALDAYLQEQSETAVGTPNAADEK